MRGLGTPHVRDSVGVPFLYRRYTVNKPMGPIQRPLTGYSQPSKEAFVRWAERNLWLIWYQMFSWEAAMVWGDPVALAEMFGYHGA
jgi:hypothetical protein